MDEIARRVGRSPILTARDVRPTQPEFEVQAVLNPAAVRLPDGEIVLLVRVAQRPRSDIDPPRDALTLSMEGAQPELTPLPSRYRRDDVVPVAIRNPEGAELGYLPIYLPKDLPGLDLRDPRGVEFTHPTLGWRVTFLTQ